MRKTALLFAFLLAAPSAAGAHDVRLSDGSLWAHDHADPWFTGRPIRNVSVTAPQLFDCHTATWPDIPAACLQPVRTVKAEKGDRLGRPAVPAAQLAETGPRVLRGTEAAVPELLFARLAFREGS